MADIYMHQKMANDFIERNASFYKNEAMKQATILGSQGPDPFYYRVFSNKRSRSMDTGNLMHDKHTTKNLTYLAEYLKKNYTPELHAFFLGYVLHYTLDVKVHPYVYHHVGVYDSNDPNTHEQRGLHLKFERRMDKCLIEKDTGKKAHKYPLYDKALPYTHVPGSIRKMIDASGKDIYGIKTAGKDYAKGYRGMRFTLRHIIRDEKGLKKKFYAFLDKFSTHRDLFFEDLSFFYKKTLRYDYLNQGNYSWNHPVTSEPSTKSVATLYEEAHDNAKIIHTAISRYLFNNETPDFAALFENRSYNKGINCDDDRPMKDFELFTKKLD